MAITDDKSVSVASSWNLRWNRLDLKTLYDWLWVGISIRVVVVEQ